MVTTVVKRDGRIQNFSYNKIKKSIMLAGLVESVELDEIYAEIKKVIDKIRYDEIKVEQIEDIVFNVMKNHDKNVEINRYIKFQIERNKERERKTPMMKILEELTYKDAKDNDIKRENANIDGDTPMGMMLKYGSESAKKFYELFILKTEHSEAHKSGDIHIHDLDFYTLTTTCCQIDLIKLFSSGFSTGHGFLREPKDIMTYASLACIAIQSNQNDQHGGQSVPNFDYAMSLGVRKTFVKLYRQNILKSVEILTSDESLAQQASQIVDKVIKEHDVLPTLGNTTSYQEYEYKYLMDLLKDEALVEKLQSYVLKQTIKETDRATYQAMEALIHNLNTMHSRAGAQIPFSSINYGTDTTPEGRLVVKNVLLATEAGLGRGETPIFPIQIFKVKEGINYNEEDINYDLFKLACRVSAKRLFPNFSFIDAPFNIKYYHEGHPETEIAYMGCRTRVIGNVYDPSRETVYGRGNLSFTTINLPRLGIRSNGNIEYFYTELDRLINLVTDQLLARFEIQASKKVKNYPFLMGQGVWLDSEKLDYEDEIREVLKHGTLTIGFIGLAECLKALVGQHHGESEEAFKLGYEIISHMRKRMDEASAKYGLNFSVIATPAEGLSGRFVKIDRKIYGSIPGVTDREYYTNSFHIPVYHKINAIKKIQLEAPFHELTNAGHITYIELDGSPLNNLDAFEKIVRAMKESGIGYGSLNHPVDRDPECGYVGIINDTCPQCGRKEDENNPFERIRRITGYLVGTLDRFNNAKRSEERDRIKHS